LTEIQSRQTVFGKRSNDGPVGGVVGFGWPAGPGCRWAPPTARIVCGGQWELTDKNLTHVFLAVALVKLTPLAGEGRGCSQSD